MLNLGKSDKHECFMCKNIFSQRHHLKRHLTSLKSNGKPRCIELKKVIPVDSWTQQILPHYVSGAKLPDLDMSRKKKPGRKRKKPVPSKKPKSVQGCQKCARAEKRAEKWSQRHRRLEKMSKIEKKISKKNRNFFWAPKNFIGHIYAWEAFK